VTTQARPWTITSSQNSEAVIGAQKQRLIPGVTTEIAGSEQLSAGLVVMPPGGASRAHVHERYELVIFVIEGWAVTLMGPDLEPAVQGPGDFLYIPPGVEHLAVNLSTRHRVVGMETRADPMFNEDVVLLPEVDERAPSVIAELRQQYEQGLFGRTSEKQDGPFDYQEN
jgi:uncharacterized RmlC-like cupin family protein